MAVVHWVRLGTCNTFLIQGNKGYIMVDAGNARKEKVFLKRLKRLGITPEEIKLIVITHAHFDHVGSLKAIKDICKCPVAVHEREADILQGGKFIMPPGTNLFGKTVSFIGKRVAWSGLFKYPAVRPDILVTDEMQLSAFGIDGFILPTPGHTEGSLSVVLQTGDAFVGDLAVNFMGSVTPPFAENTTELFLSWRKIVKLGVNNIYPSHGRPFGVSLLKDNKNSIDI